MRNLVISVMLLASFGLNAQSTKEVLVFGTSNEWGVGANPRLDSAWVYRLAKMIAPYGWTVYNVGVSNTTYSDTIVAGRIRLSSYFRNQRNRNPKVVVFGGPTNDGQAALGTYPDRFFQRDYEAKIDSVKKWWPTARIVVCTAFPCTKGAFLPQANLDTTVNPVVESAAITKRAVLCRFNTLPTAILSTDKIHPSNGGHGEAARFFFKLFKANFLPIPSVISTMPTPIPGVLLKIEGEKRSLILKYDKSY